MRFSATLATLMAGAALADRLAVITPCPQAPSTVYPPITVTKQYQTVSTCAATTACAGGSCSAVFPFNSFAWVSSVIPAGWNGESETTTLVTSTTQTIVVSVYATTLTKYVTGAPITKSGTVIVPAPTPHYLTIAKEFLAPFNEIGPLAIPGYGGSGLCEDCGAQADGSRQQVVDVVECRAGDFGAKCMGYEETWISKSRPAPSTTTAAPVSTRFVAPTAGTYTFTFTLTAPGHVVTSGTETITVAPSPWFAHVTRACHRREIVDFTTTITKTIYLTLPCSRQAPTTAHPMPFPTGRRPFPGFPRGGHRWPGHYSGPDPFGWTDWGNPHGVNPWGGNEWKDWNDWQTTPSVGATTSTTTSGGAGVGPIGGSTSTSYAMSMSTTSGGAGVGPIGGSTSTSYAMSMSTTSGGAGVGPIGGSTSTSYAMSTTTSNGAGVGPIGGSTTASALSASSASSASSVSFSVTSALSASSASSVTASVTSALSASSASSVSFSVTSALSASSASSVTASITSALSASSASSVTASITSALSASSASSVSFSVTSALSASSASSVTASITSALSASSASSVTASITSALSASSASTSSAPPMTTSTAPIIAQGPFFIATGGATKYRKRATSYIGFDGEDAVLVSDRALAAAFFLDINGFLISGGQYVDADFSAQYIVFGLTLFLPATLSSFTIGGDGSLTLNAPNNGFCVTPGTGAVFILFGATSTPFPCNPILLAAVPVVATTSSSITSAPTSTIGNVPSTTTAVATTTTADISGDLDDGLPAPTVRRRGIQYGGRHYYHHRH